MDIAELQLTVRSNQAEAAADRTRRKLNQVASTAETAGARMQASWDRLRGSLGGVKTLLVGIGATMAFRAAVRSIVDFEQSMADAKAVMRGITEDEFRQLNESARRFGESTVFSAAQAAQAIESLGRAGFKTNEILASLEGTLSLAAAGGLSMGEAATISAKVLRGFGLATDQAGRVADVLALAAASANQDVGDLGDSMKFVAPIARQLKVSFEEATAAVSTLADSGIVGGEAGTTLRMVFRSLLKPTAEATRTLRKYGIEAQDVNPEIVGLSNALITLRDAEISVTDASKIFEARAFTGAGVLVDNADAVKRLNDELDKAKNTSLQMAAVKLDTIKGQWELLKSAIVEFNLKLGDAGLNGSLRMLLATFTELFTMVNENWRSITLSTKVALTEIQALFWDLVGGLEFVWGSIKEAFIDVMQWIVKMTRDVLIDMARLLINNPVTQATGEMLLDMADSVQDAVKALNKNRAEAIGDMGQAARQNAAELRATAQAMVNEEFGYRLAKSIESGMEKATESVKAGVETISDDMDELLGQSEELAELQENLFRGQERVRLGAAIRRQKEVTAGTLDPAYFAHEEDKLRMIQEERMRRLEYDLTKPAQAFLDGWEIATDQFGSMTQRIASVGAGLADSLDQNLTDGFMSIIDGTKDVGTAFRDMANQIISDLIRVMIQQLIVRTALSAVGGVFGGVGGSPLGTFGSAKEGGVVGALGSSRVGVQTSSWVGASRYQMGGLAGDEVPIVAHQGERVLTKEQSRAMEAGGSRSKEVQIINVLDERMVDERIESNPNAILNVMSRNRSMFRRVLGVT